MATTQTIAIIGATGAMGSAIAKGICNGPYRILLMAGNPEKLLFLKSELEQINSDVNVDIIECATNASWEADIIIMAVPYNAESALSAKIKQVATGKIVISISNSLTSKYEGLQTGTPISAAEELQQLLPNSKVIKAFNTNLAASFLLNKSIAMKHDSFIAGNDKDAVNNVVQLVTEAGFNAVVAGALPVSQILERMQLLLVQLSKQNNSLQAGWKILLN